MGNDHSMSSGNVSDTSSYFGEDASSGSAISLASSPPPSSSSTSPRNKRHRKLRKRVASAFRMMRGGSRHPDSDNLLSNINRRLSNEQQSSDHNYENEYAMSVIHFVAMVDSIGMSNELESLLMESSNPERAIRTLLHEFQIAVNQVATSLGQAEGERAATHSNSPPPASKNAIQSLKQVQAIKGATSTNHKAPSSSSCSCNICHECYSTDDVLKVLPCGHQYHSKCIDSWLNRHCTCPLCRYELPTNDPKYEMERIKRMKERREASSSEIVSTKTQPNTNDIKDDDDVDYYELVQQMQIASWGDSDIYSYLDTTITADDEEQRTIADN